MRLNRNWKIYVVVLLICAAITLWNLFLPEAVCWISGWKLFCVTALTFFLYIPLFLEYIGQLIEESDEKFEKERKEQLKQIQKETDQRHLRGARRTEGDF